ncbi:hypothetical protein [Deinococcus maricopensis]|uniref:Uncharacterized protein n=1 Tax=Deinococcus maricopensis (strain DSM 21211 / LMG 22137 / NRRL B-23946 / LB-34) TaxID=709986 RepID=E8U750_DEIML|nr:hypothetical protein [Deinococcus maricopensis]ADV66889.1 hypothetical protein Deima_1238 [Deinococcus maricopensis DSM 21211]
MTGVRVWWGVAGAVVVALGASWVGMERRLDEQARTITQLRSTVSALRSQVAAQDASRVTARALGENCAFEVVRDFEEVREGTGRYPGVAEVSLPEACREVRVQWVMLEPRAYRFVVEDTQGRVLAKEGRP